MPRHPLQIVDLRAIDANEEHRRRGSHRGRELHAPIRGAHRNVRDDEGVAKARENGGVLRRVERRQRVKQRGVVGQRFACTCREYGVAVRAAQDGAFKRVHRRHHAFTQLQVGGPDLNQR